MTNHPAPKDIQSKLCDLAERIASKYFDIHLDYSIDSVQQVEGILEKLHDEYRKTRSDEGLNGVALEFAAYIVTVIQRHFGPAEWERDCPSFGQDVFPLHWRGGSIYPYAWCQKRIFDGSADNVWFKFQAIVLSHSILNEGLNYDRTA